jgi:hypothetical protein
LVFDVVMIEVKVIWWQDGEIMYDAALRAIILELNARSPSQPSISDLTAWMWREMDQLLLQQYGAVRQGYGGHPHGMNLQFPNQEAYVAYLLTWGEKKV